MVRRVWRDRAEAWRAGTGKTGIAARRHPAIKNGLGLMTRPLNNRFASADCAAAPSHGRMAGAFFRGGYRIATRFAGEDDCPSSCKAVCIVFLPVWLVQIRLGFDRGPLASRRQMPCICGRLWLDRLVVASVETVSSLVQFLERWRPQCPIRSGRRNCEPSSCRWTRRSTHCPAGISGPAARSPRSPLPPDRTACSHVLDHTLS